MRIHLARIAVYALLLLIGVTFLVDAVVSRTYGWAGLFLVMTVLVIRNAIIPYVRTHGRTLTIWLYLRMRCRPDAIRDLMIRPNRAGDYLSIGALLPVVSRGRHPPDIARYLIEHGLTEYLRILRSHGESPSHRRGVLLLLPTLSDPSVISAQSRYAISQFILLGDHDLSAVAFQALARLMCSPAERSPSVVSMLLTVGTEHGCRS
jgi:hypothetical protein